VPCSPSAPLLSSHSFALYLPPSRPLPSPPRRVRVAFNCISVETLRRGKSAAQGRPSSRERRTPFSSSPFPSPASDREEEALPVGVRALTSALPLRNHPSVHFRFATRRGTNARGEREGRRGLTAE